MKSFLKEQGPLIFILTLGMAYRLVFLFTTSFDSDMAFVGLMGKHILEGERPLIFYGDTYVSSFGGYLVAPVFALFGMSLTVFRLSRIYFPFFFMFTTYLLGKQIHSKEVGLLAALLTALAPYLVLNYNLESQNGYVELFVAGNLILLLTCQMMNADPASVSWKKYALLGLLYGLGYAYHPQCVYFIGTSLIFVFFFNRKRLFSKKTAFLFFGACLGAICVLSWNALHHFHFLRFTKSYDTIQQPLVPSFLALFTSRIPMVLGAIDPRSKTWVLPWVSAFALGLFAAGFLAAFWKRAAAWVRNRRPEKVDVILVYLILLPVIFFASGFYKAPTQRYLIFLYPGVALLFSVFLATIRKKNPAGCYALLGAVLVSTVASDVKSDIFPSPQRRNFLRQESAKAEELGAFLEKNQMRLNYVGDYWDGAKNSFLLGEKIILAAPFADRYPLWTLQADAAPRPAFVLRSKEARIFRESMKLIGGQWQEKKVAQWNLSYDFQPPPRGAVELEPQGWKVSSNRSADEAFKVLDRKINTNWRARGGTASLEVDLGAQQKISQIVLLMGKKGLFTPRAFKVSLSCDGKTWKEAAAADGYKAPLFWSGPHPFWKQREGRVEVRFEPQEAQFIRVENSPKNSKFDWVVSEFLVYAPSLQPFQPNFYLEPVISFLEGQGIRSLYCDFWESAAITLKTKGKIRCLTEDYKLAGARDYFINGYDGTFPYFNLLRRRVNFSSDAGILLLKDEAAALEKKLRDRGIDFQKKLFGDYQLYYGWQIQTQKYQPISRANWTPNPVLQVDFKNEQAVRKIEIILARDLRNKGVNVFVESSLDGEHWQAVPIHSDAALYWTGVNLVESEGGKRLAYRIQNPSVRALRMKVEDLQKKKPLKVKKVVLYE